MYHRVHGFSLHEKAAGATQSVTQYRIGESSGSTMEANGIAIAEISCYLVQLQPLAAVFQDDGSQQLTVRVGQLTYPVASYTQGAYIHTYKYRYINALLQVSDTVCTYIHTYMYIHTYSTYR